MPSVAAVMVEEPTGFEWKVLRALQTVSRLHGDPTLSEIALAMSPPSNVATVHRAVERLVGKGWISHHRRYRARGIRLLYEVLDE